MVLMSASVNYLNLFTFTKVTIVIEWCNYKTVYNPVIYIENANYQMKNDNSWIKLLAAITPYVLL